MNSLSLKLSHIPIELGYITGRICDVNEARELPLRLRIDYFIPTRLEIAMNANSSLPRVYGGPPEHKKGQSGDSECEITDRFGCRYRKPSQGISVISLA